MLEVQLWALRSTVPMSFHPHHRAVLRLDHHLGELLDTGEPGIGIDVG